MDPRRSEVVELRFFGGLSVAETAAVLAISPETVMRDWKLARAWLRRELEDAARDGSLIAGAGSRDLPRRAGRAAGRSTDARC